MPTASAHIALCRPPLLGKYDRPCQKARAAPPGRTAGMIEFQESFMSVRAIPLLVLAFLLYNAIVLTLGVELSAKRDFQNSSLERW